MATGRQPEELGINCLVLCDNTKTQKVSSKSMTMHAKLEFGRKPVRRYSDKQNLRPDSQHSLLPDFPIVLVSNRPYRAT